MLLLLLLLLLLSAEAPAIGHLLSRDTRLRRPSVVESRPALLVFRLASVGVATEPAVAAAVSVTTGVAISPAGTECFAAFPDAAAAC